jgi:hypothetical protein
VVSRVAEAIAVVLGFARTLSPTIESSRVVLGFRWTGLSGRYLVSWGSNLLLWDDRWRAHDASVTSFIELPANTPDAAIAPLVQAATRPLFEAFGGFELPPQTIENVVAQLLSRRGR